MNKTIDNSHKEDEELMLLVAERDMGAYRKLVAKYLNRTTRFAERMLGDYAAAEDMAQELAFKIWNEAPRWQPKAHFSTWLYRVLTNACIDYQRKKRPVYFMEMNDVHDEMPSQVEAMMAKERAGNIREAMESLPERQRAALVLCYYEELSNENAAEVLGVNIGALQQLLFRARQNLKGLLEGEVENKLESKKSEKNEGEYAERRIQNAGQ